MFGVVVTNWQRRLSHQPKKNNYLQRRAPQQVSVCLLRTRGATEGKTSPENISPLKDKNKKKLMETITDVFILPLTVIMQLNYSFGPLALLVFCQMFSIIYNKSCVVYFPADLSGFTANVSH